MPNRTAQIERFLRSHSWDPATRTFLAGDASARRYERLHDALTNRRAVLMDASPDDGEDILPFIQVAENLSQDGLSAPAIYAHDPVLGLALIEDFGDDLFAKVAADNEETELELYSAAVDVLLDIRARPAPEQLQPYSNAVYAQEAQLLVDWYMPGATGEPVSEPTASAYLGIVRSACEVHAPQTNCFVLRDFHAENLFWLSDRKDLQRVGLIDFQDAFAGHSAYDLVSLLEDARRDTSTALRDAMIERYLSKSGLNETQFLRAYATLGAQRNLKIIGIFSRLCMRDGKAGYLDLIPRVWAHLMRDLQHPALSDLQDFVAKNVPAPEQSVLQSIRSKTA